MGAAASHAENDVAAPGTRASRRITERCADDQVGQPIAIDVAGPRDARATSIVGLLAVDHEAATASSDRGEVDGVAAGLAQNDVAAPDNSTAARRRADDQVGETVAVDVASGRDAPTTRVAGESTVDHETASACSDRRQVDGAAAGLAENDVAAARIRAHRRIAQRHSDNHVGETIAVDVTSTRDAPAHVVIGPPAVDHEAATAGSDRGEIDRAAGFAENDVAATAIRTRNRKAVMSADDQVGKPVAIDITGRRHALATLVIGTLPIDHKAADAGGDTRKIDTHGCS